MKHILKGADAREKLISGINLVANSVKITLGPSGKNAIIRTIGTTEPFTSKDGATISREIYSADPIERLAIECMQQVATQSEQQAGDGTTTATILAQAIFKHFTDVAHADNYNILEYKKGLDYACQEIVKQIEKDSKIIENDYDELLNVAMVSSNHDEIVSKVVVDSFKTSGDNGIVNIQRSKEGKTYLHTVDGIVMPISYRHLGFINNKNQETCELNNPFVLMTNQKITSLTDNFHEILDIVATEDQELLILANDIHDDVMEYMTANAIDKRIRLCVCRALGYGKEQRDVLEDLSVLLNTTAFLEDNAYNWNNLDLEEPKKEGDLSRLEKLEKILPRVKSVVVNNKSTSIKTYELTEETQKALNKRIEWIQTLVDEKPKEQEYEKNVMKSRKARLTNGISYINIHANSEMEYVEIQHRIEDCLHSVKWANAKGIVPGGGSYLDFLSNTLEVGAHSDQVMNKEKIDGAIALIDSLSSVFEQVLSNGGVELSKIERDTISHSFNIGYDLKKNQVGDMFEMGIVDSSHVLIRAIINAATIAGDIISTDLVIVDDTLYQERRSVF